MYIHKGGDHVKADLFGVSKTRQNRLSTAKRLTELPQEPPVWKLKDFTASFCSLCSTEVTADFKAIKEL